MQNKGKPKKTNGNQRKTKEDQCETTEIHHYHYHYYHHYYHHYHY